jgi:ornithine carbamoyltransferase/carbamoyltransferase
MPDQRSLLTLRDLDRVTLHDLVQRAVQLSRDPGAHDNPLRGLVAGLLFRRTSTRTRTSFQSGALRLGGAAISYGPGDLQTNTGETVEDTGRVLSAMLDLLVVRTAGPMSEIRALGGNGAMPLVNAMSAEEHPTQAITDLATLTAHHGPIDGLRLLYVGEGNNTAVALAWAFARSRDCHALFVTPPGYGLPAEVLHETAGGDAAGGTRAAGGTGIEETHDLHDLPRHVDVVYTTRWQTTGTVKPDPDWRQTFAPYSVDRTLMARWPSAVVLHDLPAHRGEEISGEVLDGPRSLAWAQARMKLYAAMAVLEWVVS